MRRHVVIPYSFLSTMNIALKKSAIWGTDVYTDDSDIFAGILSFCKIYVFSNSSFWKIHSFQYAK